MDGWTDGEILIIGMMVGWSGGVSKCLPCVKSRCGAWLFFWSFFLNAIFFNFFRVKNVKLRRKRATGIEDSGRERLGDSNIA